MTSGRFNQPQRITCETCGSSALWAGGRRRRFCSQKCKDKSATAKSKARKPRRPAKPKIGARHRDIVNMTKLQRGSCCDCGLIINAETICCIDFDHRDPQDKSFTIAYKMGAVPDNLLIAEIAKCDAVCRNCHAIRTHKAKHWAFRKSTTNEINLFNYQEAI